ncbi:MAG: hypothetical protein ACK5YR_03845 [Pirellula sp.]|jgi:hypothetical protein
MATVTKTPPIPQKSVFDVDANSLRTNSVDKVSSLLTSLLVLVCLAVFLLGLLFFLRAGQPQAKALVLEPERIAGRGENAEGFERDFDPPAADEVEMTEPPIDQTLQMVAEAITSVSELMDGMQNDGTGKGDSRPPGPEGEGDDIIPRFERWDIKFQARDKKNYATQLDFFKIELGTYGAGIPRVEYVANLASSPVKRTGLPKDDKRLYFLSVADGALKRYDKQFLQSAGINVGTRPPIKFFPKETEELLAQAEAQYYVKNRNPEFRVTDVGKTVFECRPSAAGKGYEFVVTDQRYRNKLTKK